MYMVASEISQLTEPYTCIALANVNAWFEITLNAEWLDCCRTRSTSAT